MDNSVLLLMVEFHLETVNRLCYFTDRFIILARPKVHMYQSDEAIRTNDMARLYCNVSGDADSIVWLKDGIPIESDQRVNIENDGSSLIISMARVRFVSSLTFEKLKVYLSRSMRNFFSGLTMVCTSASRPIRWAKIWVNWGLWSRVCLHIHYLLYFLIDSSIYEFRFHFLGKPQLVKTPANTTASLGEIVTLECQAEGHPTPIISWYHNNATVRMSSTHSIIRNGSLR